MSFTLILCAIITIIIAIIQRNKILNYVNGPNPLGQMFYLLLSFVVTLGFYLVYDQLSGFKRIMGILLILSSDLSFIKASTADPGIISKKNLIRYQNMYHYDYVLYSPRECRTCKFLKVARSKHCSVCNRCIARQDHHCVWLNNCVGYGNFKWFLWFLLSNLATTFYLGIIGFEFLCRDSILVFLERLYMFLSRSFNTAGFYSLASFRDLLYRDLFKNCSSKYPLETGWVVFNLTASFIVLIFSIFALYPSFVTGMTLNESIKWEELEESLKIEAVEMESLILECNQKNVKITEEILQEAVKSKEKVIVNSTKQLRNIYAAGRGGIYENIKEIFA
jgi:palmitoyltransferase